MIPIKHYGDITKIHGNEVEAVDVITGGSPCQDLSVAGKRAGLAGERSGLFMEQIRIIKEMRNETGQLRMRRADEHIRPRFMVWENVYGAFSSNKGDDFRCVLEEIVHVKDKDAIIPEPPKDGWPHAGFIMGEGYSVAWRGHDAQFWGVPQRRKRICVLADFDGGAAPKILFELWREAIDTEPDKAIADTGCESRPEIQSLSQGMSGDTEPGGKEGEGTPEDTQDCIGETGKCLNSWDVQSKHIQPQNGIAESLYSGECRGGGGESYVLQTYGISAYDSNSMKSPNPHSGIYEADTTRTLDLNGGNPACNQGGMAVVYGLDRASFNQGKNAQFGFSVLEEQSPTITAKGPGGCYNIASDTVGALCASDCKGAGNQYVNDGKCVIQCGRPYDTKNR